MRRMVRDVRRQEICIVRKKNRTRRATRLYVKNVGPGEGLYETR